MGKTIALALVLTYLAVTPLCLANVGHATHALQGMHMSTEHTHVPLSYHTGMYRSFTTALFLALALLSLVALAGISAEVLTLPVSAFHGNFVRRAADPPPDTLFSRLALFTLAPPVRL